MREEGSSCLLAHLPWSATTFPSLRASPTRTANLESLDAKKLACLRDPQAVDLDGYLPFGQVDHF